MQYIHLVVLQLFYSTSHILAIDYRLFELKPQAAIPDILLAKKACEIASQYISQSNIVYTSNHNSIEILEAHLHKCISKLPIYIRKMKRYSLEPLRHGNSLNIFVISEQDQQLEHITDFLNRNQREKHFHKYIFIWRGASTEKLLQFFRHVFEKSILQAIALTDYAHAYTFQPFSEVGFEIKQIYTAPYFYEKLKNLHGYQLKISMFADTISARPRANLQHGYDAVDGMVARTIVQRLNATVRYVLPPDKENYGKCIKGNFTGVLQDLIPGKTHAALNVRFLLHCVEKHVEGTYPFDRRIIHLVVPAAEMRPLYWIFINAFTNSLWRVLIANFFIVFLVFALMERCTKFITVYGNTKRHNWFETFELFYKSHLGEPVEGFAKISSLRQFLIAWIFFCYVVTSIYFAKLESNFVQPAYESDMDSLSQLYQLKVPIYGITNFFTVIQSDIDPKYWPLIQSKAVRMPLTLSGKDYSLPIIKKFNGKAAFILRTEHALDLLIKYWNDEQKRSKFHIVREHLFARPNMYITTLGSPFLHKFDQLIRRFHEYGLMQFWIDSDVKRRKAEEVDIYPAHETGMETTPGNSFNNEEKKVVLSLEILQGAFYLWSFGIAFSLIGFMAEYLHWMCRKYVSQVRRSRREKILFL